MNFKIFIIFVICVATRENSHAEGFLMNPFEHLTRQFDIIKNKIFSWNPFHKTPTMFDDLEEEIVYIQDTLDDVDNITDVRRHYYYGCECVSYKCGCCSHIEVNRLKLNNTGCLNMTYFDLNNIELSFDIDGNVYYNNTISIVNPPDLCFGTPVVSLAKLCLKFYQLDARNRSFSGSVDLIAKFDGKQVARIKLGSFHFGNSSRFYEQNLMSILFNKNNLMYSYGNMTDELSKINKVGKNFMSETYGSLVDKLEKIALPEVSIQTDKIFKNLLKPFFIPRMKIKDNANVNSYLSSKLETTSTESNSTVNLDLSSKLETTSTESNSTVN